MLINVEKTTRKKERKNNSFLFLGKLVRKIKTLVLENQLKKSLKLFKHFLPKLICSLSVISALIHILFFFDILKPVLTYNK